MAELFEYYAAQTVLPTYAGFTADADLAQYVELRNTVFRRLALVPALFDGKRVLEFGPDSGENSLVFARWGARLTLVEPNAAAHSHIGRYFSRFELDDHLEGIAASSLLEFTTDREFDIIDAEGFIYTLKPHQAWIRQAANCLKTDGLFIISYMELYGSFMELLLKAIYHRLVRCPGYAAGVETAKRLFLPKWDSVPHTRSFESWFMDVIENPFVSMAYCIDPVELIRDMHAGGFRLYSSWPTYRNALAMDWIKKPSTRQEEVSSATSFIERSRLSHFLGSSCFLPVPCDRLASGLRSVVNVVDALIDNFSETACATAAQLLGDVLGSLPRVGLAASSSDVAAATEILRMAQRLIELMGRGGADALIDVCRHDQVFLGTWGMPCHYAVFQKAD